MAILIKEISVKTVIERSLHKRTEVDATSISKLKRELLSELKETIRQEITRKNER